MIEPESDQDREYMREAISLAVANVAKGGGPFGAVIVRDGEIIGRGANTVTASNDPSAHAEVNAIRDACQRLSTFDLSGCQIYASCEPCPMCLSAIYWARLSKLYYASSKDDAARAGFDDVMILEEMAASDADKRLPITQTMQEEAREAFQAWQADEDRIEY